jgi:5-methylcytosine-specific restriction protein A
MPTTPPRYSPFKALRQSGLVRPAKQVRDERRGTAHERGYGARWQATRLGYLQRHPLCCCCKANGLVRAATVLDHIQPHRGDMGLFWDPTNWQGLDADCHNRIKKLFEDRWDRGEIGLTDLRLNRPLPEFFAPLGG